MMLQAIMRSNPGSDFIYVVDTRPKVTLCVARLGRRGKRRPDHRLTNS